MKFSSGASCSFQQVDLRLEPVDVALLDARQRAHRLVGLGDAEVGSEVEEVVLDLRERRRETLRRAPRERHPELGVELVDGAVALDPQVVLGDTRPGTERGAAVVAGAGVDSRQSRHGVILERAGRPRARGPGEEVELG